MNGVGHCDAPGGVLTSSPAEGMSIRPERVKATFQGYGAQRPRPQGACGWHGRRSGAWRGTREGDFGHSSFNNPRGLPSDTCLCVISFCSFRAAAGRALGR